MLDGSGATLLQRHVTLTYWTILIFFDGYLSQQVNRPRDIEQTAGNTHVGPASEKRISLSLELTDSESSLPLWSGPSGEKRV